MNRFGYFVVVFALTLLGNLFSPFTALAAPPVPQQYYPRVPSPLTGNITFDPDNLTFTTASSGSKIITLTIYTKKEFFKPGESYSFTAYYNYGGEDRDSPNKIATSNIPSSPTALSFSWDLATNKNWRRIGLWTFEIYKGATWLAGTQIYSGEFLMMQPNNKYPEIRPLHNIPVIPTKTSPKILLSNSYSGLPYIFWWKGKDTIEVLHFGKGLSIPDEITIPGTSVGKFEKEEVLTLCMTINNLAIDGPSDEACEQFNYRLQFRIGAATAGAAGGIIITNPTSGSGQGCKYTYSIGLVKFDNLVGDKQGVATALGCIPSTPSEFIMSVLLLGLSVGGGISFLLMIFGAFEMIMSGGNPESLQAGQDRFQSSIIGLLSVIFSILLLQIIVSDILQIPGLTK